MFLNIQIFLSFFLISVTRRSGLFLRSSASYRIVLEVYPNHISKIRFFPTIPNPERGEYTSIAVTLFFMCRCTDDAQMRIYIIRPKNLMCAFRSLIIRVLSRKTVFLTSIGLQDVFDQNINWRNDRN
jgi:hypothetical protein